MRKLGALILLALPLFGCSDEKKLNEIESKVIQLEKMVTSSEAEISNLNVKISELESKNKSLESTLKFNDFLNEIDKFAYLTPGGSGYSTIRFDLGVLTVDLADIKPYANGSKITLNFGNTLSSSIDGLKGTFEWGTVDENGSPLNDKSKTKEITFSEVLVAGSWTQISIVLDGIPPEEFGFLRLKNFSHTGIRLRR